MCTQERNSFGRDVEPLDFIQSQHQATQRNYLERMLDAKVDCMKIAREFGFDYWDGQRRFGFGGYRYIPGYWSTLTRALVKRYSLGEKAKILDVGCGKGFLLFEFQNALPHSALYGFDISPYAIKHTHPHLRGKIWQQDARSALQFDANHFDLVLSLNTLHNLNLPDICFALSEISRVSRNSYIVVESFRSEQELFNLQCWALTAKTLISPDDWLWLFKKCGYRGDYEFIYFE